MLHIHNKLVYRSVKYIALAICLGLLWRVNSLVLSNPSYIPVDDFSFYWTAGKLTLQGENPYDPEKTRIIRNSISANNANWTSNTIWNPPWSIALLLPFGAFPYPIARLLWLVTSIGIVMVCSDTIWQILSNGRRNLWLVWLMVFMFGPTISALQKGQVTPWILAGITGFIYFIKIKPNDWIAGAFASLISLKPQLFYLFWPAFLLWSLVHRRWVLVTSFALTIMVASLPGLLLNHSLITQYFHAALENTPKDMATPTIGGYLRLWLGIEKFYLQFLPVVLGLGCFLWYWKKNKHSWSWQNSMPFLLFVSLITSAYTFTYDQVILIPTILVPLSKLDKSTNRKPVWIFASLLMTINLIYLLLHRYLNEFWFVWVAPAYLICYLVGNWMARRKPVPAAQ